MMDRVQGDSADETKPVIDEPPPVLGTWSRVYTWVLIYLAVVIAIFYWLTSTLRP